MSVNTSAAPAKCTTPVRPRRWRYQPELNMPHLSSHESMRIQSQPQALAQLLSAETLQQLAQQCQAADRRQRKLTCTVFFWLTVLAFGPGGTTNLHQLASHLVSAGLLAGLHLSAGSLSKEALSENFRERPWQYFEAVLAHLLQAYAHWWQQLAGLPQRLVVEQLHVLLIDSTSMQVAMIPNLVAGATMKFEIRTRTGPRSTVPGAGDAWRSPRPRTCPRP